MSAPDPNEIINPYTLDVIGHQPRTALQAQLDALKRTRIAAVEAAKIARRDQRRAEDHIVNIDALIRQYEEAIGKI